jgi:GT2 family glycosyltransferase
MVKIAILLTCFNRKEKTLSCLKAIYSQKELGSNFLIQVYLVNDGSTDGTPETVKKSFSLVKIINGTGNLFWAGGMRLAWQTAIDTDKYDYFLLLNDDTVLFDNAIFNILKSNEEQTKKLMKKGISIGTTIDEISGKITYGGKKLKGKIFPTSYNVFDNNEAIACDLGNANIMFISSSVVDKIGILSSKFTHGIADYDYTLRTKKAGFWVMVSPGYAGFCSDDHGRSWKGGNVALSERISFLYSHKGLSYKEYLYFIKLHFPLNLPFAFIKLWLKTLFPFIYDRFKKNN